MKRSKKPLRDPILETLRRLLPDPVQKEEVGEVITLTAGSPGLVTVTLDQEGIVVAIFGIRWNGPHTPVRDDRQLARVTWSEFRSHETEGLIAVQHLVQAAILLRRGAFRQCSYCGKNTPPEWWHGENACQGCAEQHLGVVH